jgi:hypothetical protein
MGVSSRWFFVVCVIPWFASGAGAQVTPVVLGGPGSGLVLSRDGMSVLRLSPGGTAQRWRDGVWIPISGDSSLSPQVRTISGDGNVVVGTILISSNERVTGLWTQATGWTAADSDTRNRVLALNHDGSSGRGVTNGSDSISPHNVSFGGPFQFQRSTTLGGAGTSADVFSFASMSDDGARGLYTGTAPFGGPNGLFMYSANTDPVEFSYPGGITPNVVLQNTARAAAISGDGRVVYGQWTFQGSVVGGGMQTVNGILRWEEGVGAQMLAGLTIDDLGASLSNIESNATGSLLLAKQTQRVYLHELGVAMPVLQYLESVEGASFAGWTDVSVSDLSADGRTFVGTGTFDGGTRAWRLEVPGPGTVGAVLAGLVAALRRRGSGVQR